ncbi:copper resistance D family protein [Psychromonas arctica]|uniref:copper resistance D family protein n=1 Tax=Psychromonas arctica TaxID=168275 RepID=UPI0006875C8B|nr:CopD family protein [Psychromonas arctica]
MIELTIWDYSNIVSKLFIYIGVATAIGGPFMAFLINSSVNNKSILHYIVISCVVGFMAVIVNFFIQVGTFSEAGVSGMFDTDMVSFLWQSAVGESVVWRLIAFTTLGVALFFGHFNVKYETFSVKHAIFTLFYVVTILFFAYSFTFVGHSADIGSVAKWLIGFHIMTMAWWVGALYPLWLSCKLLQPPALYKLMCLFGQIAMVMVGLLIVCGISLLYLVFDSPVELLTAQYGQAILLKLVFVVCILLIAAYHKYHLVEEVQEEKVCHKLQSSIKNEIIIALIILTVTAVLSSALGPISLA